MPIRITCPACQATYSIADRYQGKTIRCPKCKDVVRIPGVVADEFVADEDDEEFDLPAKPYQTENLYSLAAEEH